MRRQEVAAFWSRWTRQLRWVIVCVSLASLGTAPVALKLLSRADGDFKLAHGSDSRQAAHKVGSTFPSKSRAKTSVILAEASTTLASIQDDWCAWERDVTADIASKFGTCDANTSKCELCETCDVRSVQSWCGLNDARATQLGAPLVDKGDVADSTRAIVEIAYDGKMSFQDRARLNHWIERRSKSLAPRTLDIGYTGVDPLFDSGIQGTKRDLENIDSRSLPIALLVMALTLGSSTLIVVPVCVMLFATVVEFAVMSAVATVYDIVSFAPSVMMTLTLAVSFDYSLFFCSRYLEARAAHVEDRVADVLESAGHTVVVSGTTLVLCFLGLLFFPSGVLRGLAVAVSVGLSSALLFTLLLIPAIFHVAGETLCRGHERLVRLVTRQKCTPGNDRKGPNVWERATRVVWDDRRVAVFVVSAVVALSLPASIRCLSLIELADPTLDSPAPSPEEHAYSRIQKHFGGGSVAPYTVLFKGSGNMLSQASLDAMDQVLYRDLTDATNDAMAPLSITSLTRLAGQRLNASDYEFCSSNKKILRPNFCPSLIGLMGEYLSKDSASAAATVVVQGDAFSTSGFDFVEDARRALHRSNTTFADQGVYLDGVPAQYKDIIADLYGSFPLVIGLTLAVVFVLLGIAFGSVAVPLRSVAALCLTLSFSFGTCVLVYQRSRLDVSFLSTHGRGRGVAWLAPLICFSIIVGLALDYDVFLLARVHEYRFLRRNSDKDALLNAVARTGVIITSAGTIMAVAFGGLFLSTSTILNQCAFLLCTAVLYDTFVIRPLFMPSLISISRQYAWWPTRGPSPDDDEQQGGDDETPDTNYTLLDDDGRAASEISCTGQHVASQMV